VHEGIHLPLANGDSPLYHPGVHTSELRATLDYVRSGLHRPDNVQ
jgi:hypothetical protein